MAWNPEQYLKFSQPRFRPAQDLLARVTADAPQTVVDLGCGAGNVTQMLAGRWNSARITGIDSSAEMIAEAAKLPGNIAWQEQSIAAWQADAPVDVIYSNAALHWLGDHATLFPQLMRQLAPGGTLAVQMPRNFGAPSHTLIWETVAAQAWKGDFGHIPRNSPVAEPRFYYECIAPAAARIDIWETEYLQVLEGKDPVKEWTKGTWLKQFLDALDPAERADFEEDYAKRLRAAYPTLPDGKTLFPFRRLFIVATRA
ncbi:methyltransferase domain-containing protein [Propionivibrio dicarboxylicus]|uniref:Trans-aconitate 2-methyltransferase n=1 Tax=Propionivibrio dicarboxylicus TaxID=83767 RepID=A0A1G8DEZ1_9RHOO|nr:methyltransferase domain-containing protein [Propionivibrio dicarboxylicus]SDH56278.1 trans-aconitate 2-methyltransferase [Propionivibrio dicarboxylicus]